MTNTISFRILLMSKFSIQETNRLAEKFIQIFTYLVRDRRPSSLWLHGVCVLWSDLTALHSRCLDITCSLNKNNWYFYNRYSKCNWKMSVGEWMKLNPVKSSENLENIECRHLSRSLSEHVRVIGLEPSTDLRDGTDGLVLQLNTLAHKPNNINVSTVRLAETWMLWSCI